MTIDTTTPAAMVPIDHAAVLRHLGLNPTDPATQTLMLACERYGLDPVLKHAVLIQGRLYVTRDGLLQVAHASQVLDGIEVLEEGETDTHWTAKVAVYRKDMNRPFSYRGRYSKSGKNKEYGPEMAVKVAEVATLRRAFNVALATREEQDLDGEHASTTVTQAAPAASRDNGVGRESGAASATEAPAAAGTGEAIAAAGDTKVNPLTALRTICDGLKITLKEAKEHLVTLEGYDKLRTANWQAHIGRHWDDAKLNQAAVDLEAHFWDEDDEDGSDEGEAE